VVKLHMCVVAQSGPCTGAGRLQISVYPELCLDTRPQGPRGPEAAGRAAPRRPGCNYGRAAGDTNLAFRDLLGTILAAAATKMDPSSSLKARFVSTAARP
jgi:hypothetical protein